MIYLQAAAMQLALVDNGEQDHVQDGGTRSLSRCSALQCQPTSAATYRCEAVCI